CVLAGPRRPDRAGCTLRWFAIPARDREVK
ncbi:hypothetical protein DYADSP32_3909, partial [Dyadobacter sp. 32]